MPVAGAGVQYFCRPVACLIFVRFPGDGCSAGGLPFVAVSGTVYVMLWYGSAGSVLRHRFCPFFCGCFSVHKPFARGHVLAWLLDSLLLGSVR